jgi:serine/threonine-protein kinase
VRSGGNGVVFNSQVLNADHKIPQECAVKFLRRLDRTRLDRFTNEIRIISGLSHERIAAYFDHGEVEVAPEVVVNWVAMELGGSNFQDHVRSHGPIDFGKLVWIGSEMCDALDYLHAQNIIHRDIKPANFVWDINDNRHVKMIDLGIAKYIGEDVSARPLDEFTQHLEFVGPAFYSSPELIAYANNKAHPVTIQSDLFQLGRVLWFLGTGKISAGVPSKKDCPAGGKFRELIINLVDDDPESRIASAAEVAKLLQDI